MDPRKYLLKQATKLIKLNNKFELDSAKQGIADKTAPKHYINFMKDFKKYVTTEAKKEIDKLKTMSTKQLQNFVKSNSEAPEIVSKKILPKPSKKSPPKLKVIEGSRKMTKNEKLLRDIFDKKRGGMIGGNELVSSLYDKV